MLKFYRDSVPDAELYEERLNEVGYIYINVDKMYSIMKYDEAARATCRFLAESLIKVNSSGKYIDIGDESTYNYLLDVEYCPEYRLASKKTKKGYSLDKKKVLLPLYEDGYATEFLEPFLKFKSLTNQCSKINNVLRDSNRDDGLKNIYGESIGKLGFSAEKKTNLRFNYNNSDIITIPKNYNSCITVPKGYVLAWGDFAQSDLRIAYNLFIRDAENAKIMDACSDKYEGMARIVAKFEGKEFDLEKFKRERDLYKVHVLQTIYGGQPKGSAEDREFISMLQRFLKQCPRYAEYLNRLDTKCLLGLPLQLESYFGHTEIFNIGYNKSEAINFGLNSPNQTGTSQIMILTVNQILDLFYSNGYTSDDIRVYYCRHDEPIFIMKEHVLKDAWIFKECSEILVDNWTPLEMDFHFGYVYKEPVEQLELRVENSYKINKDKITQIPLDTSTEYSYYPVTETLILEMGYSVVDDDKSVICLYNKIKNSCKYFELGSSNASVIMTAIRNLLEKDASNLSETYGGCIAYNPVTDGEDYLDGLYIKYLRLSNHSNKASVLAELFASKKYPDKYSMDTVVHLYEINKGWIPSIENNSIME